MSTRVVLSMMLTFIAFSAQAKESQWLINLIAKQEGAVNQQRKEPINKKGQGFFSTHGLIFFYGSQCPHCKQFAPVLKTWANRNEAEVLALSLDNQPLPEFPQYLTATTEWINVAFQGAPINYPALFVVNPTSNALYPVGFGSMTESELNARVEALMAKINAYEHTGNAP